MVVKREMYEVGNGISVPALSCIVRLYTIVAVNGNGNSRSPLSLVDLKKKGGYNGVIFECDTKDCTWCNRLRNDALFKLQSQLQPEPESNIEYICVAYDDTTGHINGWMHFHSLSLQRAYIKTKFHHHVQIVEALIIGLINLSPVTN